VTMHSTKSNSSAEKKIGNRRRGRETALQMLYLMDNCKFTAVEVKEILLSIEDVHPNTKNFALELCEGVCSQMKNLDEMIMKRAKNWKLDRMAVIDRNILRIAAYEMVGMPQTPVNVIIDEAVEIAKSFSTSESGKFVNGILDKIKAERSPVPETSCEKPTNGQT